VKEAFHSQRLNLQRAITVSKNTTAIGCGVGIVVRNADEKISRFRIAKHAADGAKQIVAAAFPLSAARLVNFWRFPSLSALVRAQGLW
jgi:hypothetical protein